MSSQGSRSPSSSRGGRNGQRSPSPKRENKPYKLYVTNLDTKCDETKLKDELEQLFSKYGQIASIVLKLSFNKEYRYAFVDYKEGEDATEALDKLNGVMVSDKPMKVQEQDNSRRRKATSGGDCYKCGKPGHFARQCRSERIDDRDRRRRSRSRSKDRKKKKSHRHRSESSESAHAKKKDKKKHKSHKKHKKSKKKHYSSDSESSD